MFKKDFFLGVMLSLVLLPFAALAQPAAEAPSVTQRDAESLVSAFMAYTDLRIRSIQQSLEVLAATAEVKSGDWDRMKNLLRGYEKSDNGFIVWYVRPDGSYDTVDRGLMEIKLSDRSYFPGLMGGHPVAGTVVISKSTGQRSAIIAVPVRKGDKVNGAVGVSLFLDHLAEQIDTILDLQGNASFFALTPNAQTTLHRKTERHFLDPRELGSASLKEAVNTMLANAAGEVSYDFDNARKTAVYRTSPLTGWKFAVVFSTVPEE